VFLALEAADRLARSLSATGPLAAEDVAESLFALRGGPVELAVAILDTVVGDDVRLQRQGEYVCLAATPWADVPLERAPFAVLDIETTGFLARGSSITEAAVVRLEGGRIVEELELLASEHSPGDLVTTLLEAAADSVLVGHNVRFDLAFLDRALSRSGSKIAAPVIDTLPLARRLLVGRAERLTLLALAEFFGTSARPAHRALPDAMTTVEVFGALTALAREAGARTVADLSAIGRARTRGQVRGAR
jgi:DNA polymerase III epsilon subunit-like protein